MTPRAGHGRAGMGRRFHGPFYGGSSVILMPPVQTVVAAPPAEPQLFIPIGEGMPGFKKYQVKADLQLVPSMGEALPTPGIGLLCMGVDPCKNYTYLQRVTLPVGTVIYATQLDNDKANGLLSTVLTYSTGERVKVKFPAGSVVSQAAEVANAKVYKDTGTGTMGNESVSSAAYLGTAGALIGFAYGLYFAFQKGSGFWGYVGYGILFNTIGWAVGSAGGLTLKAVTK